MKIKCDKIDKMIISLEKSGNAVRDCVAHWGKYEQVILMEKKLENSIVLEIQNHYPSLRYWHVEGTPHNRPEQGFTCEECMVSISFPI